MRLWWESSRHLLVEADPEAPPALSPHGLTWPARRPLPQQPQGQDGHVLHSHLLPSRPCSQVVPREVDRCACNQETLSHRDLLWETTGTAMPRPLSTATPSEGARKMGTGKAH